MKNSKQDKDTTGALVTGGVVGVGCLLMAGPFIIVVLLFVFAVLTT